MPQSIARIALVVRDYDEAIAFYTKTLGFELLEDTDLGEGKGWVVVAPPGGQGTALLLAKAKNNQQRERVGDQTGGRVFLFLHTDQFERDYQRYKSHGVEFIEEPRHEAYGRVVVFTDIYGNRWDLVERNSSNP